MAKIRPLVSVIIPFYNVEQCVEYCMTAVLSQTMANYEVICVDDGSTDATGAILAEFAKSPKVRILRKQNGGLSDARNYGVLRAKGRYVTFVDGDDVVSPYYLEALVSPLNPQEELPAKPLVVAPATSVKIGKVRDVAWQKPAPARGVDRTDFLQMLLYNEITESAWAKLAQREVYELLPFPFGRKYEDLATVTALIDRCDSFFVIDTAIYGYVHRFGSIVHASQPQPKQFSDYSQALQDFEQFLPNSPVFLDGLKFRRALTYSRMHALTNHMSRPQQVVRNCDKNNRRYVRRNLITIVKDNRIKLAMRARLLLVAYAPSLHDLLIQAFERFR